MAPVREYVSAFSVSNDRITASRQGPRYAHRRDHWRQYSSVSSAILYGSRVQGWHEEEGSHVSEKETRWPGKTANSATLDSGRPSVLRSDVNVSPSGPATACSAFG